MKKNITLYVALVTIVLFKEKKTKRLKVNFVATPKFRKLKNSAPIIFPAEKNYTQYATGALVYKNSQEKNPMFELVFDKPIRIQAHRSPQFSKNALKITLE